MSSKSASSSAVNATERRLPGAELKQRREAAGHSLAAVAKDTYITHAKLTALEADDYDNVGSYTFVVGYIRKYAKWLGINADDMVRAYEEMQVEVPPHDSNIQTETEPQRHQQQRESNKSPMNLPLLWLVAAFLAIWVVMALWLSNGGEDTKSPAAQNTVQTTNVPTDIAVDKGDKPDDSHTGSPSTVDADSPTGGDDDIAGADLDNNAGLLPGESPSSEAVAAAPSTTGETAGVAVGGSDILVMSFSDECWVEVHDANGNLLFARLQQAGDNLQLTGRAPFAVMLGQARAVDMRVNGRPINTNPGGARDTLRLNVGP